MIYVFFPIVSRNSVTNVVLVLLSVLHFVMSCLRGTCVTFWTCIDNRETVLRLHGTPMGVNCYT